jgi:hypothetical protein
MPPGGDVMSAGIHEGAKLHLPLLCHDRVFLESSFSLGLQ